MSLITTLQEPRRPWPRRVLAAPMLVSANVMLQPCVMAMPAPGFPADQFPINTNHKLLPNRDNTARLKGITVELKDVSSKAMAARPVSLLPWQTALSVCAAAVKLFTECPPSGPTLTVRNGVYLI